MSFLGVLAGMGDAAWAKHQEDLRHEHEYRQGIAQQLEQIGTDENWTPEARETALRHRLTVLDPKTKLNPKLTDQMWADVHNASARTVNGAAERNSQRFTIGQVQQQANQPFQPSFSQQPQPQFQPTPMPPTDETQGAPAEDTVAGLSTSLANTQGQFNLDMLRPHAEAATAVRNATFDQHIAALRAPLQGFGGMTAEPTVAYGPKTPAERATEMIPAQRAQWEAMRDLYQSGNGGDNSDVILAPTLSGGKAGIRPFRNSVGDKMGWFAYPDDPPGAPLHLGAIDSYPGGRDVESATGRPVNVHQWTAYDRPTTVQTVDANGQPVTRGTTAYSMLGQDVAKPVQNKYFAGSGPNGEQIITAVRPGFNGAPDQKVESFTRGVMPFAGLIGKGHMLSNEQRALMIRMLPYMGQTMVVQNLQGGQSLVNPRAMVAAELGIDPEQTSQLSVMQVPGGGMQMSPERLKAFQQLKMSMEQLAAARDLLQQHPDMAGGILGMRGRWQKFKQNVNAVSPDERKVFLELEKFFNNYRVAITGAQASLPEIQMLRQVSPDIANPNIMSDLDTTMSEMLTAYKTITGGQDWQRQGLQPVTAQSVQVRPPAPLPQVPGVHPKPKAQSNDLSGVPTDELFRRLLAGGQ